MGQPLKPAPPGYRWIYTPHFRHRQSGKLIRTNDHGKARLPVPCAGRPPLIKGGASRSRLARDRCQGGNLHEDKT